MSKQRELGLRAFSRPKGYCNLSANTQWESDKMLGILDWDGTGLTEEELKQLKEHCT